MPRSSSYTTTSCLDAISGVLPSLLLLVHLPPFRCNRLNRRSRSIITRRAERDEKKKRDVEWGERWGEVRWGEVRWGKVRWGEERRGEERMKRIQLIMWGRYMSYWWRHSLLEVTLEAPLPFSHVCLSSVHTFVSTTNNTEMSLKSKSNFLKANKINEYKVISINLKFIRSLLSYYYIIVDIFGEALSPLPSPLLT